MWGWVRSTRRSRTSFVFLLHLRRAKTGPMGEPRPDREVCVVGLQEQPSPSGGQPEREARSKRMGASAQGCLRPPKAAQACVFPLHSSPSGLLHAFRSLGRGVVED